MTTSTTTSALRYLGLVATPSRPAPRPARRSAGGVRRPGPPRGILPRILGWLGLAEAPILVTGHPRMRARVLENLRRRRQRDQMVTITVGALLGIALLCLGLVRSPLLDVEDVSVVGLTTAQEEVVSGVLGVSEGTNVLDVDLARLTDQAQSLPWVDVVTARRRLPSTVEIRVVLNAPVATAQVGETIVLLDDEGMAVESVPVGSQPVSLDRPPDQLPSIQLATAPQVGVPQVDPAVRALAGIAAAMPPALDDWIVGYTPSGIDEVDALMRVPSPTGPVEFTAHLGRAEDIRQKAASLAALVREAVDRGTPFRAVDVRIPDRPFVLT
jgi:hypothetical protein